MRITPYNQITSSVTITPSTNNLDYSFENLLDTYANMVMKFTGYTDENIVFFKSDYFVFDSIGIVNHNLTSGATITIEANTSDSWGSPPYQETLTWRSYLMYDFITDVDLADTYDYVRIRFQDSGNTEPIKIGNIILGDYIQLPGFQADVNKIIQNEGTGYIGNSGQAGGNSKYTFRQVEVNMGDFSNTQRQTIEALIETNGDYKPGMAVLWESAFDKELPMYAVYERRKSFTQNDNELNNWNTSFTIREVF